MEKFKCKLKYMEADNCYFIGGKYNNGNTGLEIWSDEVGPIAKVTVNPEVRIPEDFIAVKDYSENEGMVDFLKSMGIIKATPNNEIYSGHVTIPVYELTDKGKEILFVK